MRTPQTIKEIDKLKTLKILIPRTVLGDCTNITLSKVNTTKQVGSTKKCFTSKKNKIDSSTKNCGQSLHAIKNNKILSGKKTSVNEKTILKSRDLKNHHNMNADGCSDNDKKLSKNCHDQLHEPEIRPSIPLTKRLRKGTVKNYLESTLEDSTNQCTLDKSKSKVPIYRQQIPILPKSKSSDPYALDIIDTNENKRKKKKRSSAKFNKTMYNVMEKIEKRERKVTRKKKLKKMSPSYEDKIQNVMKKVLHKVHENNSVNRSDSTPKLGTSVISNKSKMLKTHSDIGDGFQGFDNNDKSISSASHLSLLNSFERSAMCIPSTSTFPNKQINIISNIPIEQIPNSTIINTANSSHMNTTCQDIDPNKMNTTSNIDPLEKSHNLHREFHNDISFFNEHTLDETCEFDLDDYVEDKDDEFFGFQDENSEEETTVQRLYKKRIVPWRFQGYFKRIPHILKLKKNGLPCKQQEMVVDYEFVQRIEALCSKKSSNYSNPKSPVQTTMLKYVESTHDEPIRPSLFDYEEFNIAKTPRRVLGVIQNNKVISTPTKKLQAVIMSPNVSIIASNENEENVLLKSPRKSYQKKFVQRKKNENEKVLDEGALPSILENNPEAPQDDDVHLFEDVDKEKETDFTITLPVVKYEQKRRRKRQISEGSDDEKKSKKKKKNMMTKAEEIEFNAWADKMNTRFAEEDLHELTIE